MQLLALPLGVCLIVASCADAFYLPGAAPHDFLAGERVELFVNALTPMIANVDNAKLVSQLRCD